MTDVKRRVIDEDAPLAVLRLATCQKLNDLGDIRVADLVLLKETALCLGVLVYLRLEQTAVVRGNVQVVFGDTAALTALVDEFEKLAKTVP